MDTGGTDPHDTERESTMSKNTATVPTEDEFGTAPVPEIVSNKRAEHPMAAKFRAKVAELAATAGEDGRSTVAATLIVADENLTKYIRLAQRAGTDNGVTVCREVSPILNANGAPSGSFTLKLWTKPKVVQAKRAATTTV